MSAKKTKKRDERKGRVLETVGRKVRVFDGQRNWICHLSGKRAVIGDDVRWTPSAEDQEKQEGKLLKVLPRRSSFSRIDPRGRKQVLLANLRGLVIVDAFVKPLPHPDLMYRYLTAANKSGLEAVLVVNKHDLGETEEMLSSAKAWQKLGYEPHFVSSKNGEGIDGLVDALESGLWAFVGRSGVGKTSLLNEILVRSGEGDTLGRVGELSEHWSTGTHTTTYSRIFSINDDLDIADSPGLRNLIPADLSTDDVREFFPGLKGALCKFRNCTHLGQEVGCIAPEELLPEEAMKAYRGLYTELSIVKDDWS